MIDDSRYHYRLIKELWDTGSYFCDESETEYAQIGEISDGYHTFNELYDHRCMLFVMLMQQFKDNAWYAHKHDDGEVWEGWILCAIDLPTGTIDYHIPVSMEPLLKGITQLDKGKPYDGHNSNDVLNRMREYLELNNVKIGNRLDEIS